VNYVHSKGVKIKAKVKIQNFLQKVALAVGIVATTMTMTTVGFLSASTQALAANNSYPPTSAAGGGSAYSSFQLFKTADLRWMKPVGGDDCSNSPGLKKSLRNFEGFTLTPAKIMGKDSRCPLPYGKKANSVDKMFYGVGAFLYIDKDRACQSIVGNPCRATGHLVADGDIVITTAHTFRDDNTGSRLSNKQIIKGFRYYAKVWVPRGLRRTVSPYEFREYEIEEVQFGNDDEYANRGKDYAFVKLKERVGEWIGKLDAKGNKIEKYGRRKVPQSKLVPPLPFKKFD